MKNRSHRHPPDDWVEESWTVDCVCGVNFDDGEEMVNCDECGVWVHTRCSHYVKSEKSFACDKCKSKNSRNDSEETEVAQLLVELPTKTLRMDNPFPWNCPPRRPFRLWTDIPMEERVHVQGIPGGDPALFGGLTSIFTPELWKCTGYVPKKFNFQYKEFPCWDKKQESSAKNKQGNENPAEKGGVLFSSSKESTLTAPLATLVGMEKQTEECSYDRVPPLNDMKKWEGDNMSVGHPLSGAKERGLLCPFVIQSGKREKEEMWTSKDRNAKKKARIIDKEGDVKKKAVHGPRKGSAFSSDSKALEFYDDRDHKIFKSEIKNGNLRDIVPDNRLSDGCALVGKDVDVPKNNTVCSSEVRSSDICRHIISTGSKPTENKGSIQVSAMIESSPKTDDDATSLLGHTDNGCVSIKEEIVGVGLDNVDDNGGSASKSVEIYSHNSESLVESMVTNATKIEDKQNIQESSMKILTSSLQTIVEVKTEVDAAKSGGGFDVASSSLIDKMDGTVPLAQHLEMSTDRLSENVKVRDKAISNSQYNDHKVQGIDRITEEISDCQRGRADELPADPCQVKRQSEVSEGSFFVRRCSSSLKHASIPAEEPSSQHKMIASVGKAPSMSSSVVISKPGFSDNRRSTDTPSHDLVTKHRGTSDSNISAKKDNASTDITRAEDGHEMPKKISKEHPKSSVSCVLKASHSTKISHNSSKRSLLDSKDLMRCSSSKASSAQNIAVSPVLGDSASSLQTQSASHVQNKITASGLSQRIEKVNQSSHQSSKMNSMPSMHPPASSNSTAALSDEELALLLHQELNSSPRVPRVPRMRHAGSLPQLTSPTTTSMLIKRTSSSGGKDHNSVSKKKTKDIAKDGSCSSRDISGEAKKIDKVTASYQMHDSVCTTVPFTIGEADGESAKGVQSIKKSTRRISVGTASVSLSSSTEANEQNFSSVQKSPRNASDDDAGTIGGPTHHHTLPGLIAEIMNKGKRMTYEELCNAVLPHWPNLRKHNGERYAYSSHSQAVLDCLRNRHEWARLVDRGPKTSTSRKRRKLDAEPPSFESDDSEHRKDRRANAVESKSFEPHREDFPKGKRKARKRRRVALQERGIKDVRRSKEDVLSDDDIVSFSSSSEESMFSEDEVLEAGTTPVGSEASASSDEMGAMS